MASRGRQTALSLWGKKWPPKGTLLVSQPGAIGATTSGLRDPPWEKNGAGGASPAGGFLVGRALCLYARVLDSSGDRKQAGLGRRQRKGRGHGWLGVQGRIEGTRGPAPNEGRARPTGPTQYTPGPAGHIFAEPSNSAPSSKARRRGFCAVCSDWGEGSADSHSSGSPPVERHCLADGVAGLWPRTRRGALRGSEEGHHLRG